MNARHASKLGVNVCTET